jgi:hypothetical protein
MDTGSRVSIYRRRAAVEHFLVGAVACRSGQVLQELGQASERYFEQLTAALQRRLCTCCGKQPVCFLPTCTATLVPDACCMSSHQASLTAERHQLLTQ